MPTTITPERPDSADAVALIAELDGVLAPGYLAASRHGSSVEKLVREGVAFYVIRQDGGPAGCGGIQLLGVEYGEVKRMYVRPAFRGRGVGRMMLDRLVAHALEHGVTLVRLETGIHQREAIGLYERYGFRRIGPFGAYRPDPLSVFFENRIEAERRAQP